jgi:hypothetical protein
MSGVAPAHLRLHQVPRAARLVATEETRRRSDWTWHMGHRGPQPRRLRGDQARVWKTRGPQTAGPFVVCRPISGQDTEVDFYSSSPLHGPTRIRATVQWKCAQQLSLRRPVDLNHWRPNRTEQEVKALRRLLASYVLLYSIQSEVAILSSVILSHHSLVYLVQQPC